MITREKADKIRQSVTPGVVREVRRALGENTATFGARFAASSRTIEGWEQGLRRPTMLAALAIDKLRKQTVS